MLLKGSKEEKPIIKSVKFTIVKIVNNTLTVSEDTEQFKDPLEQEMATHSSRLAWTVPWTAEPGGLQSFSFHNIISV